MGKVIDLTGIRFSRWFVIRRIGQVGSAWLCRCDCGNIRSVDGGNLRSRLSHGCGCNRGQSNTTHGHNRRGVRTRTYRAWEAMKTRVLNPQNIDDRERYSARGIKICERWMTFENFLFDMGECPENVPHSLDRVDNDKGYEPGNCRWATRDVQNRNTRRNKWVLLAGRRMVLKDAVRALKVSEAAVYNEMRRHSLSHQVALDRVAARRGL